MQRQKIRPSYTDLQDEFNQSDDSKSEDNVPQYAPAAIPIRGVPPPVIAASSSIQKAKRSHQVKGTLKTISSEPSTSKSSIHPKVVRIAPSSSTQVHEIESRSSSRFAQSQKTNTRDQPDRFRFSFDDDKVTSDDVEDGEIPQGPGPLIGTIQERVGLEKGTATKPASEKKMSKFAQSKREERKVDPVKTVEKANDNTDVWLDEDEEPMSAFRKDRLLKQGKRPPAVASPAAVATSKSKDEHFGNAPLPLDTAFADPIQSMIQSISLENEAKVARMSAEQVEESLRDLSDTLGSDVLEKLRKRKERRKMDVPQSQEAKASSKPVRQLEAKDTENTPEQIRSRYFPNEPNVLPPSLQWTKEPENNKEHGKQSDESEFRFDFSGRVVGARSLSDQDSHLAGLHHHGDEQDRAGYTLTELLHLARSTLPSQCILALQTLERVFRRYTRNVDEQESKPTSQESQIAIYLIASHTRSKAAVIASWYIEDRQVSIQSAALRCLDACLIPDILRALTILSKGQEKAALNLVKKILPTKEEIASDLFVLQPFINEMLRQESSLHKDEDDIDPISGVDLWESASTGLPLRADWPFIALDDLLHSGNCASLNRKNVLSSNWDANERQIVVSSLRIGLQMWRKVLAQKRESLDVLPSPAEIRLAAIKVFMLEEAQGQDGRASGLITGRDLYRDEQISSLIVNLLELARSIEQLRKRSTVGDDDMEKAAQRHFGASLPFYQLYTNLIGLYDSISFGMELFGRVLLLAQPNQYASDYRRLLWIDYGHCLPTIQTRLNQNPFHDLKQFLWTESKDDTIVQAMMNALLQGKITKERNELLYQIAVQQLGHIIWYSEDLKRTRLVEIIFGLNRTNTDVQAAIKQYRLDDDANRQIEEQRRQDWILATCSPN